MAQEREFELVVTKVENKKVQSKNVDATYYSLHAEHTNHGLPKVTLTSEDPWDGYKYGDIISVKLSNTQTSIKDYTEANEVTGGKKTKDPMKEDLRSQRDKNIEKMNNMKAKNSGKKVVIKPKAK